MKFVDITYPVGITSSISPAGINPPRVIPRSRMAEGGRNNTSYVEFFAHAGTHLDMPWHFNPDGKQILDFAAGEFIFSQVALLDIPKGAWENISYEELAPAEAVIQRSDALLVRTGFGRTRSMDPENYFRANPGFEVQAARYLAGFVNLRCIGVDLHSVENLEHNRPLNYPVHHALLDRPEPLFLLEDADLQAIPAGPILRLYALPLRIEGLEASPVRAVVEFA